MSLPLATTKGSILRAAAADAYAEPYSGAGPATRTVVASGVRAIIDAPTGSEQVAGGVQTTDRFRLLADPCDLTYTDWWRDDNTGVVYRVVWALPMNDTAGRPDHVEAALELVEGLV